MKKIKVIAIIIRHLTKGESKKQDEEAYNE